MNEPDLIVLLRADLVSVGEIDDPVLRELAARDVMAQLERAVAQIRSVRSTACREMLGKMSQRQVADKTGLGRRTVRELTR